MYEKGMVMKPSEYFNRPVLGTITVTNIFKDLLPVGETTDYEVIDEDEKFFVCNQWYKEHKKELQYIPKCLNNWKKNY
jgi:hypothetical protein